MGNRQNMNSIQNTNELRTDNNNNYNFYSYTSKELFEKFIIFYMMNYKIIII